MKKHYVKWIFQGFAFGLALNTLADFLFSYSLQLGYYAPLSGFPAGKAGRRTERRAFSGLPVRRRRRGGPLPVEKVCA